MAVCIRVSMRRAITYVDGAITTTPCRCRHALQEESSRQRRRLGSPPVCAAHGPRELAPFALLDRMRPQSSRQLSGEAERRLGLNAGATVEPAEATVACTCNNNHYINRLDR